MYTISLPHVRIRHVNCVINLSKKKLPEKLTNFCAPLRMLIFIAYRLLSFGRDDISLSTNCFVGEHHWNYTRNRQFLLRFHVIAYEFSESRKGMQTVSGKLMKYKSSTPTAIGTRDRKKSRHKTHSPITFHLCFVLPSDVVLRDGCKRWQGRRQRKRRLCNGACQYCKQAEHKYRMVYETPLHIHYHASQFSLCSMLQS